MLRTTATAALVALLSTLALAPRAAGATIDVASGGDLQAALDRAQPGDVVVLARGATFVGNFVLGVKGGADFITVRSAVADRDIPRVGMRVPPAVLHGLLACIKSPNAEAALRTAPGAHHWRLVALEFGPSADGGGDIVRLGDGGPAQRDLASVPHDLVLDRCYVHGDPNASQKRGIALNSASTTIVNSWITDIKAVGQDSQAIAGWNGPGPFTIADSYLEAAGENVMLGGSDPWIDGLVPTGVTIRGNFVRKSPAWRAGPWQVKNLLELKNARGVLIENNLFENNWEAAQPGYAILLTPRNQDGRAPWSVVQDVTIRNNVVRHVSSAFNILGHDSPNPSQQTRDVQIVQNLVYDVNPGAWGGSGNFLLIGDSPANVTVEHNTVLQSGNIVVAYGGTADAPSPVTGFVLRNNVVLANAYGIKGDNRASGNGTLNAYFPGAVVVGNVIAGGDGSLYPGGNLFPSIADLYAQFVNASGGNFTLLSSSRYGKAASDGTAVGVAPSIAEAMQVWVPTSGQVAKPRAGRVR